MLKNTLLSDSWVLVMGLKSIKPLCHTKIVLVTVLMNLKRFLKLYLYSYCSLCE